MIAQLRGTVVGHRAGALVLQVAGTGLALEVIVPERSLVESGAELTLHTSLQMSSEGPMLAGFESLEELTIFSHFLDVNGVGPRTAVRVLSTHPAKRIVQALDQEDPKAFQIVPGIGRKLANRIILELRGKLVPEDGIAGLTPAGEELADALDALLTLGYTHAEATHALNQTAGEALSVEARIAGALRDLSGRKGA